MASRSSGIRVGGFQEGAVGGIVARGWRHRRARGERDAVRTGFFADDVRHGDRSFESRTVERPKRGDDAFAGGGENCRWFSIFDFDLFPDP
jgi:hypothetical protein